MTRQRPASAPRPPHPDAAQRAITAELVRLTFTRDERPELVAHIAHPTPRRKKTRS